MSEASRLKIGEASRRMWANPENRAKLSASMVKRGKKRFASMSESERAAFLERGKEASKAGRELFHKRHPEHAQKLQEHRKAYLSKPENTGENFHNARCWSLKSPDGKIFQFHNLNHFVRTNTHLFTAEQLELTKKGRPRIAERLQELSPRRKRSGNQVFGWSWHVNHESIDILNREQLTP